VYDATASFSTNALTVGRNGNKINAVASDMTLDIDRMGMRFTYFDATQGWVQTGVLRA
jgi:hypothetical protein